MSDPTLFMSLKRDLRVAREEAAKVAVDDGGSMSADMVFIPVGKAHRIKRFSGAMDELLGSRIDTSWWHGYLMSPPGNGVATRRLVACETMAKVLNEKGWGARTFYQRD